MIKFGMNVVFEKIFDPYFFLFAMVDVKGVKTTLKVEGLKHILLNISEIIEDIVLCFLTTNVMVYTILQKNLLFKQYM